MKRHSSPIEIHSNQHRLASVVAPLINRTGIAVEGTPVRSNVLFMPKHINATDPFFVGRQVLSVFPEKRFSVVAKPSLFRWTFGVLPKLGVVPVERSKDVQTTDPSDRIKYIHDHAATFAGQLTTTNVVGMSFGESTRTPGVVKRVKVGPVIAAAYAAREIGMPFPVQAVGLAGNSLSSIILGGDQKKPRAALVYAPPVYVQESVLKGDSGVDESLVSDYRDMLTESLACATNQARDIIGHDPLDIA